jgi:hypothetical protein
MADTEALLMRVILYGLLPLWGVCGFVDWWCHRATRIETTSGLKESLIHSLMGVQLGIPIVLCLVFQVNLLILLICVAAWLAHEFVAHWDVVHATPRRHISIWEVHVHNYMATLPLFLLMLLVVINWDVLVAAAHGDFAGQFTFTRVDVPHGSERYLPHYLTFMGLVCVAPYLEENLRCLRARLRSRTGAA